MPIVSSPTPLLKSILLSLPLLLAACGDDVAPSATPAPANTPTQGSGTGQSPAPAPLTLPGKTTSTGIGEVLVFGAKDRTLYTFANDQPGTSNCNDTCAQNWPPITAPGSMSDGPFSTIERSDNTWQWSFKGSALYYYAGDAEIGQINGEGLGGVWFVARPDPVGIGPSALGDVQVVQGSTNAGGADSATRNQFDGRTLYVFDNDTPDQSNCYNGCAQVWPPLYADKGAVASDGFSLVSRDDGSTQWAFNAKPLYLYVGDAAPGDTNGEGIGGVWRVARP